MRSALHLLARAASSALKICIFMIFGTKEYRVYSNWEELFRRQRPFQVIEAGRA